MLKKKILRTETSFLVRSISLSRWKSYAKKNPKDRNRILGSINITEQVEKKILRTETSFSVQSISPSRWKPYAEKNPKDKNLILGLVNTTEQVETLCLNMWKLAVHLLKKANMCCVKHPIFGGLIYRTVEIIHGHTCKKKSGNKKKGGR